MHLSLVKVFYNAKKPLLCLTFIKKISLKKKVLLKKNSHLTFVNIATYYA